MKYETMVRLHKLSFLNWNFGSLYGFDPKPEYTIFDLLGFIPGIIGTKVGQGLEWLWNHRKRWVIARKTSSEAKETPEKPRFLNPGERE